MKYAVSFKYVARTNAKKHLACSNATMTMTAVHLMIQLYVVQENAHSSAMKFSPNLNLSLQKK